MWWPPGGSRCVYLHVWPISNGLVFNQYAMPVIEMGEIVTDERERNKSQKKTGNKVTVVTLKDVEKIRNWPMPSMPAAARWLVPAWSATPGCWTSWSPTATH